MEKNIRQARTYSVNDALLLSLDELGCIDFLYMSALTGKTKRDIIEELYGAIFQNPDRVNDVDEGWELSCEYLSGDIYHKYQSAIKARETYGDLFDINVKALEKCFPKKLDKTDIYVTLGSPWIPTDIVDEFIRFLLGDFFNFRGSQYKTKHDSITGHWDIPVKGRYGRQHILSNVRYGIPEMNALTIIEKTLNHQLISLGDSRLTILALERQELIIGEFNKWLWSDVNRTQRIIDIYQREYGCYRAKYYNGSFLCLKSLSPKVELYPYQKDGVARIIMSDNTLLAHDVGAGKTYIMIVAGMELRRLGKSEKNLYVVPNNILEQWHDLFMELYPEADVFVASPKLFEPTKRIDTLKRIKDEDHDAILMAYSSFDSIRCSKAWQVEELEREVASVQREYEAIGHDTSTLKRYLTTRKKELDDLRYHSSGRYVSKKEGLSFDQLGINTLFIDEAHNYKNVPLKSGIRFMGINNTGSDKCEEMLRKVRCVQLQNNGRGIVMATGTPITNSISDVYIFQKYLQYDELKKLNISDFSDWVGMYAGMDTNFEVDVDTSNFRVVSRLSKFYNIPELTALFSQVVDFHTMNQQGLPKTNGRDDCVVPASATFREFLGEISDRVDALRSKRSDYRKQVKPDFMNNRQRNQHGQPDFKANDNMLCVTTDGRKAALDLRLVNYPVLNIKTTKVYACARNVYDIYVTNKDNKSTQLIFCDTSTPKKEFNIYDELRRLLVSMGVDDNDIAYVHDYPDGVKRQELFDKVQTGDIRILIGSTFKLGIGVNVQNKLIAMHHLDVPWRPADMVQREGRILRQGNENEYVTILRYVTEESFDAYSWQLLETKQRFINEILSGMTQVRSGDDISDTVLDYAEIKALAIGDPKIKIRVMLNNELVRMKVLQKAIVSQKEELELEKIKISSNLSKLEESIFNYENDIIASFGETSQNKDKEELAKHIWSNSSERSEKDRELLIYRGLRVVIPSGASMPVNRIYLVNNGKYLVDIGKKESGVLKRIDSFIESMPKKLDDIKKNQQALIIRIHEIEDTLHDLPDYSEQIRDTKKKLDEVDAELGIDPITVRSGVLDN